MRNRNIAWVVVGLALLLGVRDGAAAGLREESGFVEAGGARLHYRLWKLDAQARRPLFVYLHGGPGANGAVFRAAVGALVVRRLGDLLLIDQRGCGRSPAGGLDPKGFTVARFAEDQHAVLAAVRRRHGELGDAVVVGHSFGAAIGVELARAHPEDLKALVLLSPALDFRDLRYHAYLAMKQRAVKEGDAAHLEVIREMEAACPPGSAREAELFAAALSGARFGFDARRFAGDEEADLYRILAAREGEPMHVEEQWRRFVEVDGLDRKDLTPELAFLRVPVAVIAGEEDFLTPPGCVAKIAALGRDVKVRMVARAGHHPYLLHPETFVEILKDVSVGR